MSTRFPPMARLFVKHLLVALIAVALGMTLGQGLVLAESKTIFVPGAGNVGAGETTGNASGGSRGRSTSTTLLYYIRAHIKIMAHRPSSSG